VKSKRRNRGGVLWFGPANYEPESRGRRSKPRCLGYPLVKHGARKELEEREEEEEK